MVFICGDYEFLTRMYGLSGASGKLKNNLHIRDAEVDKKTSWSGRHCCLWCHITSSQLSETPSSRAVTLRTNTTLERDLQAFESDGGDIKKAKEFNNVIRKQYLSVALEKAGYIVMRI